MARKIKELPADLTGNRGSKYPFDEWFDGDTWELVAGEDFTVVPISLTGRIYQEARARKLQVKTRIRDGNVYVQAIGVNGE